MKKNYLFLVIISILLMQAGALGCESKIAGLEKEHGADVAVFAINMDNGKVVNYHGDERVVYCSTFKVLLAAEVMQKNTPEEMEKVIHYSQEDIVMYSPITEKNIAKGMTLAEICEAALRVSDNTAANLLFYEIGGPIKFRELLRRSGDNITIPQKMEPMLNVVREGYIHDTSTARQIVLDYKKYLLTDEILTKDKREKILSYMTGNSATAKLIVAGVPEECLVFDKSGSGPYGIRNDVAIIKNGDKEPIIMGIFTSHSDFKAKADDELVAELAKVVYKELL